MAAAEISYPLLDDGGGRQSVPMFPQDDRPSTSTSNSLLDKKQDFNILEKLKQLRDQKKYCDVILDVRGTKLEAHKNVLASWSPYFASKLQASDSSVYKDQIVVNYDNIEVFADMIDFMYNGYVAPRETNFLQLLHLAVSFQIGTLKNYCEEFLRCNLHLGNFVSTYFLSRKFRLETLEEYIVGFLQLNLSDAVKQGEFLSLKAEKFNTFLSKGWMEKIKPEIKLFLIISWVGYDVQDREKYLVLLLGHIDWSTVANDFLLEINRTENFFTSHESSLYLLLQTLYSAGIPLGPYTEEFPKLRRSHSAILNEVVHSSLLQIETEDFHQVTVSMSPRPCHKDACVNTVKSSGGHEMVDTAMNTDVNSRHFEETEMVEPVVEQNVAVSEEEETSKEKNKQIDMFGKFIESEIQEINLKEKEKIKEGKNRIEALEYNLETKLAEISSFGTQTRLRSQRLLEKNTRMEQKVEKVGKKNAKALIVLENPEEVESMTVGEEEEEEEDHDSDADYKPEDEESRKTRDIILTHVKGKKRGRRRGVVKKIAGPKPGKAMECTYKDCAYITKFERRMEKHVKLVHESSLEIRCNLCPFEAREVRKFNSHMKQHFPGPPYACDFPRCTYTAEKIQPLLAHRSAHTGERQFNCDECGMSFKTNNTLITHRRIHSGKKDFKCHICGQCFMMKNTLNQHMVVHSDVRPYLCDLCGFSTKFQSHLIAHKRLHTGEVFKCQFPKCTYFTPKRSQLKAHMRAHLGIRAHVCQTCGKSFVEKSHLNRHEKLHTKERIHCEDCDFTTTRNDKLKEHIAKHHSAEALAKPKKAKMITIRKKKKPEEMKSEISLKKVNCEITTPMLVKWDHGGYSLSQESTDTQQAQSQTGTESSSMLSGENYCVLRDHLTSSEPIHHHILSIDQINTQMSGVKSIDTDTPLSSVSVQPEGDNLAITGSQNSIVVVNTSLSGMDISSSPAQIQQVVNGATMATAIGSDQTAQSYTIIQQAPHQTPAVTNQQEYGGLSAFMALF